jgi:hypothetical protein
MSNDNTDDEKNKTAAAIIEMLKDAGVSTSNLEETEHKFWDTQVRLALTIIVLLSCTQPPRVGGPD